MGCLDAAERAAAAYADERYAAGEILAAKFSPIPVKLRAGVWYAAMANDAGELFDDLHGHCLGGEAGWIGIYHKTRGACLAALATGERPTRYESREFLRACLSVLDAIARDNY